MNVQEFLLLHTTGVVNFASSVNVLYNEEGNISGPASITAVSVTAQAFSVNGITILPDIDLTSVIPQVETISLTFNNEDYTFTVTSVAFYPTTNPFYFFEVTSNTLVPNLNDGNLDIPAITEVSFTPYISTAIFSTSNYNLIINNATNLRKSTDKLKSDREAGFAIPTNFNAILLQSASKAEIPDSFYTDTGLINARYEGSKTVPNDSSGVPPSLTAREFTGEVFPLEVNRDYACGILNPGRILENLLHTGPFLNPGFTSSSLNIQYSDQAGFPLSPSDSVFNYAIINQDGDLTERYTIDRGDLLKFATGSSNEVLRVVAHNTAASPSILTVQRAFFGTATEISHHTPIERIDRTDILREDAFNSEILGAGSSVIYVQENNILLYTDSYGTVYSGSSCPDPLLLGIDNPNP